MVDVINGMFCVSYQIIRNHKECEGVLYPFDESNFSFSFSYWPWALGHGFFGSNKKLVPELSSWGDMKGLIEEGAHI